MKQDTIIHCIFLIFYAKAASGLCVEKLFIESEQIAEVSVNQDCLNFVEFKEEFLTKVSCENIEPYHAHCRGKVMVLRADPDVTLMYCLTNPDSLARIVDKVFLGLNSLEIYLEGEDLQNQKVSCFISTKKQEKTSTSNTLAAKNSFEK